MSCLQNCLSDISKRQPIVSAVTDIAGQLSALSEEGLDSEQNMKLLSQQMSELQEKLHARKHTVLVSNGI